MLRIGMKGKTSAVSVDEENTALAMGSGNLEVFATPAMIALMEQAACEAIEEGMSAEESSVGTLINVKHISATPMSMNVWAEAELVEVDGKRLTFCVKAFDDSGLIGEGSHERFVVSVDKFMSRTNGKGK